VHLQLTAGSAFHLADGRREVTWDLDTPPMASPLILQWLNRTG
jgi:hypothetical protein